MMSTSSVRRLKDRGGGGGKVTATAEVTKPSRSVSPLSEKLITRSADYVKKPIGKENASRPTSRIRAAAVSQKPVMKTMPRVDKSAAFAGDSAESRPRRSSSSSVPRGRSSSPSEFVRSRSSRVSIGEIDRHRVSIGEVQVKKGAFRDSDVCKNGIRSSKVGSGKSNEIGKEIELKNEKNLLSRSRVPDVVKISSISSRSSLNSELNLGSEVKGSEGVGALEKLKSDVVEKRGDAVHLGLRESLGKSLNRSGGLESNKEKGMKEQSVGGKTANKYPSKLHEKLAFLEGKVKRIASDIKRTKEMLDMNNPDASKVILSDIQETVAGIEKAMGHVVNNDDQKSGLEKLIENDNMQINGTEKCLSKQGDGTKSSVNGLNTEELEARFFPHHKLLRDRTSQKASSGNHQIDEPRIEQPASELKVEEKPLTSVDENLIAMEFLDSLSKGKSKVTAGGGKNDASLEIYEVQEIEDAVHSAAYDSSNVLNWKDVDEMNLKSNETLEDFDVQGNVQDMKIEEETEDSCTYELNDIGHKTCTGGWFVSEGESVLLAHGDGSCSFYDITNCEEKTEYKLPDGLSPNLWQDCWILRAPGADGCSGRYVVAASAGKSHESGFCSWDFYSKEVQAFSTTDKDGKVNTRKALAPLPNNPSYIRNAPSNILAPESPLRWYKPCGPLIVSTATCQKVVKVYDIRDGELIMVWQVQKPVLGMEYSSPLQWRNRGKVVLAETEGISLWDVDSQNPEALMSISSAGRKISALHINNTDAELGGGVRQRVSSSEAEGNDGVFCTADSINILDFRNPSGIGLKIPKLGTSTQSVFSRGDSIYLGCTNLRSTTKKQSCSLIQQFSIRKQKLFSTYTLPESNALSQYTAINQVYGNSNLVMGVCGVGQFVFDALDDAMQLVNADYGNAQKVKEVIGPDDLYSPSFDYLGSRLLLVSRDRPAQWRYLS